MSLINALQIDPTSLALIIQQTASGAAFSGNVINYVQGGGYLGPNVVSTTGGAQVVLGSLTMVNPITVPYVGGSGQSVARKYVDDQIASSSGTLTGAFASLTANQSINGSNIFALPLTVANPTATGHATNLLYVSGVSGALQVLINAGGGGGGGAPNAVFQSGNQTISGLKTFTGAVSVGVPTATGHAVNLGYLTGVSGILASAGVGPGYSGYVENTFVHRGTIDEAISGVKTFTGALTVGTPLLTGHAVNLGYLTGVSGLLNTQMIGTSGILSARDLAISGALQAQIGGGGVTNNFYITGTGTINTTLSASGNQTNTFTVSGLTTNTFNLSGAVSNTFNGNSTDTFNITSVTGNFVNLSFFFEAYNLNTGLNQVESFIARNFTFTGYAVAAQTSGTQGFLSGSLYQRSPLGVKTNFRDFSYNSGQFFTGVGGLSQTISGMHRVGIDLLNVGTGMTGVTVGLFGFGY